MVLRLIMKLNTLYWLYWPKTAVIYFSKHGDNYIGSEFNCVDRTFIYTTSDMWSAGDKEEEEVGGSIYPPASEEQIEMAKRDLINVMFTDMAEYL